jgi:hypothetical protein
VKFSLDQNISRIVAPPRRTAGHDVTGVGPVRQTPCDVSSNPQALVQFVAIGANQCALGGAVSGLPGIPFGSEIVIVERATGGVAEASEPVAAGAVG